MERYRLVRQIIERLYEDGEAHTLEEIRTRCQEEGIDVKADRNIVNNVVYRMREQGYLYRGEEKGAYLPGFSVEEWKRREEEREGQEDAAGQSETRRGDDTGTGRAETGGIGGMRFGTAGKSRGIGDPDRYFVLKPQKTGTQEPKLSVLERGELKLNKVLRRELPDQKIRILMSRDYRNLVLEPGGKDAHQFTKAGIAKNVQIVELLRKAKLTFPVVYRMSWNENTQVWEGRIQVDSKT
ncbi:MAG: hypothetical protein HFI31_10135 [Lachnospiraceae bacterium]|jgi:hypothetical protein|nr:hypothetical protein [Lachnospiraceae bacterium]MCI8995348.1 hypothetical protein [Lachnospiraceae bacterium]MCI9134533.1 hypothetical protein [Lachnospiraceae bacterium]